MNKKQDSSNKRGRRQANAEKRKEKLLQASVEVFNQKGYHATRIDDIVSQAKIGKGTFYLYFKDKEDVFGILLERSIGEINATLNWVMDNIQPNVSTGELFLEEAKRIFNTLKKHSLLGKIIFREGRSVSPKIEEKINGFYQELIKNSRENLEFAIQLGLLPKFNAKVVSICIIGAVEKIYQLWLQGYLDELEEQQILQETFSYLLRGCGISD